jgi:hypothetical protein
MVSFNGFASWFLLMVSSHGFFSWFLLMVSPWLSSQAADFFDTSIQNLIPQYGKCPIFGGDYVEKWLSYVCIFCTYIYNTFFFLLLVLLTA